MMGHFVMIDTEYYLNIESLTNILVIIVYLVYKAFPTWNSRGLDFECNITRDASHCPSRMH